jgi:hypothetical protein
MIMPTKPPSKAHLTLPNKVMSRILDYIAKYDENLTIAQLKQAIELERATEKEKEKEEIARVKKTFYNIYLKQTCLLLRTKCMTAFLVRSSYWTTTTSQTFPRRLNIALLRLENGATRS